MTTVNALSRRFEKEDAQARDAAIKALLQHSDGRKLLWWLLKIGNAEGFNPYTPNNHLHTAFNCGSMQVGLQVKEALLSVNPEGYTAMLIEAENERQSRNRELAAAEPERGTDDPSRDPEWN